MNNDPNDKSTSGGQQRPQHRSARRIPNAPSDTETRQIRPVYPRPQSAAQNPRPQSAAQNPRPQNGAQNPRPQNGAQNPRPQNGAQNPRPQSVAQNPRPQSAAQNPRPQNAAQNPRPQNAPQMRSRASRKKRVRTIVLRTLLVIFTIIFVLLFALIALCRTLVTGPSETVRDLLVLSAMQASATKWIPGLFLGDELVAEICAKSDEVQPHVVPMGEMTRPAETTSPSGPSDTNGTPGTEGPGSDEPPVPADPWADAVDGMIYKTYNGSTFKAYILIIKDPSRVYVGTSSDFTQNKIGARIFEIVEREGAIAAINGGEFEDPGGVGTGNNPMGLTYSKGKCMWNDGKRRTFIGFDKDNVLRVFSSMTKEKADELGIRDAVSFQTGNVLISNDGENVSLFYSEGNLGMAQRTAIGQRADGAVIMIVTDGRTASNLGATRNDIIDLLVAEGAVVAGMLDGGSSTMMYYRDYYLKYDIDQSTLDEYQLQGLVNKYKAFTKPRHLPTFFLVSP